MLTLWLLKHAKEVHHPLYVDIWKIDSVRIHTEEQVRVDSRTCTHTLVNKLKFGSKRNSRVSVFRCGVNRLLLVDPHIKHSHKGRIWGMLMEHRQHVSKSV